MSNNDMHITTLHEKTHACVSVVTNLTIRIEIFLLKIEFFLLVFPCRIAYTEHAYLNCADMPGRHKQHATSCRADTLHSPNLGHVNSKTQKALVRRQHLLHESRGLVWSQCSCQTWDPTLSR